MMGNFASASVGNFACVTDKSALRVSLYRDDRENSPRLVSFLAKDRVYMEKIKQYFNIH